MRREKARDPYVPVWARALRWARQRKGFSENRLAERAQQEWHRHQRGKKPKLSGVAIHYMETVEGRKARRSVLTAIARALGVPVRFLTGESGHIMVQIRFPGQRLPLRLHLTPGEGWAPMIDPAAEKGVEYRLASLWTNLKFWRSALLDEENARRTQKEQAYDLANDLEEYQGVPLLFFDHMARALEIALAPVSRGAEVHAGAVGRLLNSWNPQMGALYGGAPPKPSRTEERT